MESLDINNILKRNLIKTNIKDMLINFKTEKYNLLSKRGIYIYGNPGCGKSFFIKEILDEIDYDIIMYDAGDIRNKSIVETITTRNMSDKNIVSMFNGKSKPIAIVMDEIDGMNSGDKGGINSLIKLIRPKKTKKQKLEDITLNPIICIGNYKIDKKIKELMNICHVIELKTPTQNQMSEIVKYLMPTLDIKLFNTIIKYIHGDLRQLKSIYNIYKSNPNCLQVGLFTSIFQDKCLNEDTKQIATNLINYNYNIEQHSLIMNETDRTVVGLLWHENIIDMFTYIDVNKSIPIYNTILENNCFSDYIDRLTFQKQIWQFNEMSSLVKTFYNNKIYHEFCNSACKMPQPKLSESRFTKVLTKYSTEFNNSIFINNLCQKLNMDKDDMLSFFYKLKDDNDIDIIYNIVNRYEISKLDINRIYRYLDKYTDVKSDDNLQDLQDLQDLQYLQY